MINRTRKKRVKRRMTVRMVERKTKKRPKMVRKEKKRRARLMNDLYSLLLSIPRLDSQISFSDPQV